MTAFSHRIGASSRLLALFVLLGLPWFAAQRVAAQTTAAPLDLTPTEQQWLAAHPVLRVAATSDWPPFEFVDESGKYVGISVDILRHIAQQAGFTIEPVFGAWPDLYRKLRERELDIAPAMQASALRAETMLFTRPVLNFPHAIYTRRGDTAPESLAALAGRRVAVEREYYLDEYLKEQHPEIALLPVDSALDALLKVASGDADAYVGNIAVASYLIDRNVLSNIQMGASAGMGQLELSMGVRSDYATLVSILNKGIAALTPGEKRAMVNQYTVATPRIALSAEDQVWIAAHPQIRLGIDPEFAPFEYRGKDGSYQGMASDYIRILNDRTGLNMQVVPTDSWDQSVAMFQAGDLDVLPCIGKSVERESYVKFSDPYLSFHRVVITKLDTVFVGGPEDLAGLRVAVQRDSSHDAFLREQTKSPPIYYDTFAQALTAVAQGEVDCAIGNAATAAYWIKQLGLTNLRLTVPLGETVESLHFGVREDWPELVAILNKGLASIPEDEGLAIRTKWMDIQVDTGVDLHRVWRMGAGLLAVMLPLLLFIAWHNWRLRKEITHRKKAQAAMLASELNYRTLVESANSVILRMTPDGKVAFINAFGERFLGYAADEILGKSIIGTIVPATETSGRDLRALMDALARNPEKYAVNENENITKDGRRVWIAWTNRPLHDAHGALSQVLCVGNDVTTQRIAVDTLKRYEFIINTVEEMMSIVNADGCYEAVNDEWCAATGIDRETALGQPVSVVWTEQTAAESIWPRLHRCLLGELLQYEAVIDLPRRGPRHCAVTMYPFINTQRGTTHAIIVAQDVTERKETEAKLQQAMEDAKTATKAKSAFLANMSHEIRTPLNAVLGYTQLLQRSMNLSLDQRHAVMAIQRSGDHLLALINDILELSRIEAGRTELHPVSFSVAQLLQDIEIMFRVKFDAKGLSLEIALDKTIPPYVVADRNRVNQILINLVGNALKFTATGGIVVRAKRIVNVASGMQQEPPCDTAGSDTPHLCFEVEDTGCGIAPADIESIFESFEQTGTAGLRQGGTGLGLSICKTYSALMGGSIAVTSALGKGSCFRFTLPLEAGAPVAPAEASSQRRVRRVSPDRPAPRVLVVDDRDTNRDLLCRMLNEIGFVTREAGNGAEALEAFSAWEPQIVLIDLVMPVMDGREAIRRIRKIPERGTEVALIALTASTLDDEKAKVLADGANAFLRKPFREDELLEEIRRHAEVVFEYDNDGTGGTAAKELSHAEAVEALAALPADLAARLKNVLLRGAVGEAKSLAEQIRSHQPALADHLLQRAREYRLNELQSIFSGSENL